MKARPILWSAPMVLALLAGRKTQTRRVAKFEFRDGANPQFGGYTVGHYHSSVPESGYVLRSRGGGGCWNDRTKPLKPYALVGDRLWGRETFHTSPHFACLYRADYAPDSVLPKVKAHGGWKPSIFMPRRLSRLLHEVTAVRVERLLDITEADAIAEGLIRAPTTHESWKFDDRGTCYGSARSAYLAGWDTINGAGSAALNPWVWVVTFKEAKS